MKDLIILSDYFYYCFSFVTVFLPVWHIEDTAPQLLLGILLKDI